MNGHTGVHLLLCVNAMSLHVGSSDGLTAHHRAVLCVQVLSGTAFSTLPYQVFVCMDTSSVHTGRSDITPYDLEPVN